MSVKKSFAAASKRTLFHLAMLTAVLAAAAIACGVESGDRRPARQGESETLEFHRSPVTAFEQFRMDLAKDDASCSIEPSDVAVNAGDRVRLAIQLPLADIQQGATGSLEVTPVTDFWQQAEARYSDFRGRGSTTPGTLIGMLDYQGRLAAQFQARSRWTVVYNKSGQHLRAARTDRRVILNDACYWLPVRSGAEAAYLVAVLNADCMQDAYRDARKSDRDFHTHFWHQVPVPRYAAANRLHRRIARLGESLEQAAAAVRDRPGLAGAGQVKACTHIRHELRTQGLAGRLDEVVRELLPDHAAV